LHEKRSEKESVQRLETFIGSGEASIVSKGSTNDAMRHREDSEPRKERRKGVCSEGERPYGKASSPVGHQKRFWGPSDKKVRKRKVWVQFHSRDQEIHRKGDRIESVIYPRRIKKKEVEKDNEEQLHKGQTHGASTEPSGSRFNGKGESDWKVIEEDVLNSPPYTGTRGNPYE